MSLALPRPGAGEKVKRKEALSAGVLLCRLLHNDNKIAEEREIMLNKIQLDYALKRLDKALQNKLVGFVRTCVDQWPSTIASSAISASAATAPSLATQPLERTH